MTDKPEPQRSTWTNALLRNIFKVADEQKLHVIVFDQYDNTEKHCPDFRAAADALDDLIQGELEVRAADGSKRFGWFHFYMDHDGDEQLHDYTANEFCESIVKATVLTGDE